MFELAHIQSTAMSVCVCGVWSHKAGEFHNLWRMKVCQIQHREEERQVDWHGGLNATPGKE